MTSRTSVLLNFTRSYAKAPKSWKPDGVKYGLVTYYPRHPNHVDPPITPSKLLMVHRVKLFKGNPYWEKEILLQLGLKEKGREPVIVKNIPEVCAMLWRVKHLVKVTPIKLPEKLPDADDLNGTYLHENGTLYVVPKINPVCCEETEKFRNNIKRLDSETLREKLRIQWLNGTLM